MWPLMFIVGLVTVGLFIFWIAMLIDCLSKKRNKTDKLIWVIVLVFLQILGAFIYYFLVKKKYKN